ncbi:MAG: ABC transporter permease subunit [Puniceicoccales bacterium]|jgi:microcin C transport system permease protein|nr:ABC transporter permease subunit [Puniceicoccales bacterium]
MRLYLLRRLLLLPVALLGITFIAFVITRFVPGGPLDQALAEKQQAAARGRGIGLSGNNSSLSPDEELQLKRFYKLDRPLLIGYAEWLGAWAGPVNQQIVNLPPGKTTFETTLSFPCGREGKRIVNAAVPVTLSVETGPQGQRVPKVVPAPGAAAVVEAFVRGKKWEDPVGIARRATEGWLVEIFEAPARPGATAPASPVVKLDVFQRRFDGILQGQFGDSFLRGEPVLDVILGKLPVSIWFGAWSLLLTYCVCIPLGIVKALRHRTPTDNITSIVLFTGYALPGYILAVVFLYFFAFRWHLFPHSGFVSEGASELPLYKQLLDLIQHTILPLACLTSGSFALMTMLMKNSLLDNLALDYVRTAVAKGVSFRDAVLKHALRNSLVPIATSFGNCLAALLTGSFLIEKIFDIDGIGLLSFSSLVGRDYPVFLGLLTCSSFLLLLGNILSDLCVALVDPRIRFDK